MTQISVLFLCTGNICRSPTAEGVLRHKLAATGLGDRVRVDSAGTTDYHDGDSPDPRAISDCIIWKPEPFLSLHGFRKMSILLRRYGTLNIKK